MKSGETLPLVLQETQRSTQRADAQSSARANEEHATALLAQE